MCTPAWAKIFSNCYAFQCDETYDLMETMNLWAWKKIRNIWLSFSHIYYSSMRFRIRIQYWFLYILNCIQASNPNIQLYFDFMLFLIILFILFNIYAYFCCCLFMSVCRLIDSLSDRRCVYVSIVVD